MKHFLFVALDWLGGIIFSLTGMFVAKNLGQDFTQFQIMVLTALFVIALRVGRLEWK